jgi:DNA-binding FadR family transcriptional regulator
MEIILAEHSEIAEAVRDGDLNWSLKAIEAHVAGTQRALGLAPESEGSG